MGHLGVPAQTSKLSAYRVSAPGRADTTGVDETLLKYKSPIMPTSRADEHVPPTRKYLDIDVSKRVARSPVSVDILSRYTCIPCDTSSRSMKRHGLRIHVCVCVYTYMYISHESRAMLMSESYENFVFETWARVTRSRSLPLLSFRSVN